LGGALRTKRKAAKSVGRLEISSFHRAGAAQFGSGQRWKLESPNCGPLAMMGGRRFGKIWIFLRKARDLI